MSKQSPLEIWREKLVYLRREEAFAADPAQKFALKKQIEEAEAMIAELAGEHADPVALSSKGRSDDTNESTDTSAHRVMVTHHAPATEANNTMKSQAVHSSSIPATSPSDNVIRFAVVFSGKFTGADKEIVDGLLAQLRDIAADDRLSIVAVQSGSTRLILEGALECFRKILSVFKAGSLSEQLGQTVTDVKRLQLVILIHGIRTQAEWETHVRRVLEADGLTEVALIGYGYLDVFRFWFPFLTRRASVEEIRIKILDAIETRRSEHREVIVIAHSFGTFAVASILRDNPHLKLDRLLLCGSIVERQYRWDQLPNRPQQVLNEAGSKDIWPILATSSTWGYGSTGTFGFMGLNVRDRFHDFKHSDYFNGSFVEDYWEPWIHHDKYVPSAFESKRPATPWFKSILEIVPLKYVLLFLLITLLYPFVIDLVDPEFPTAVPAVRSVEPYVAEDRWNLDIHFDTSGVAMDSRLRIDVSKDPGFESLLSNEKPMGWQDWRDGEMMIGIERQSAPFAYVRVVVVDDKGASIAESAAFRFSAPRE